ncbi:serine protease SPPA, chloroplastic-like [Telopea speciosissima]|uniref:serine protease SPPA, chloroplastic-like n=1 Tax=Telopea speciosissima TaxID=54955 RepID=UPI001CC64DDF|nr:serine protease SPPA, chloroplastic-like [Telopea speciosissima]
MSKLLCNSRLKALRRRSFSAVLLKSPFLNQCSCFSSPLLHFESQIAMSLPSLFSNQRVLQSFPSSIRHRDLSIRAFKSSAVTTKEESKRDAKISDESEAKSLDDNGSLIGSKDDCYPSGEFEFKEFSGWKRFVVKLRMLFTLPWERIRKGSVLSMKLRGQIFDHVKSRLSSGLSLPQICENFIKAAYDPRISGIYLHSDPLKCGWGKVEEIRRHILDFRKSVDATLWRVCLSGSLSKLMFVSLG